MRAKSGPKIIEFKMTVVEKPVIIDEAGTTIPGLTYNVRFPGRSWLCTRGTMSK